MGIENPILAICAILTALATSISAYIAILKNTPSTIFSKYKFFVTNPCEKAIHIRNVLCS